MTDQYSWVFVTSFGNCAITPNTGLWLVESTEASYEYWWEHIWYAYLSNVTIMNIDELNISFNVKPRPLRSRSSHALLTTLVLLTTYPLTQSLGGACCFDHPPLGGAWYTCPVLIVRSSLDVYKPWWDRAGEIVVWGQIYLCAVFLVVCVCPPDLTPYDWPLYTTLNLPIDELAWETSFHSDIFRTTNWYARVTRGVYRTSSDWYVYVHYVINCV